MRSSDSSVHPLLTRDLAPRTRTRGAEPPVTVNRSARKRYVRHPWNDSESVLSDDLRILTYLAGNTAAGNLSGTYLRGPLTRRAQLLTRPPRARVRALVACSCGEGLVLPGPREACGGHGRHPPDARLCRRAQDVRARAPHMHSPCSSSCHDSHASCAALV
jgi:hypothetical protein